MRIGIIADSINEDRPSGVGNYARNLVRNLLEIDKKNEYFIIHSEKSEIEIYNKAKEIIVPYTKLLSGLRGKAVRKNILLPYALKKAELDIVHELTVTTPILLPLFTNRIKMVQTSHDLVYFLFPKMYRDMYTWYVRNTFPRILKRADKIIASSNSTKNDLINLFNVPEEKITVVYLAPSEDYKMINDLGTFKEKYGLDFKFILYVGNLIKGKNIANLTKAFFVLKKKGLEHKLIIAGKDGGDFRNIFEIAKNLNLEKDVIFTGYFPKEDLPKLYNAADLFVMPSFYEGFCLPILEAMACGCPVIASNAGFLPEVLGNAGVMVNPYDVNDLAKAMYTVLTNTQLRNDMIEKGLKRAKKFSWENTARQTVSVYEDIYNP